MSSASEEEIQETLPTPRTKTPQQLSNFKLKRTFSLDPVQYQQDNRCQKTHSDYVIQDKIERNHKLLVKKAKSLKFIKNEKFQPIKRQIRYHHKVLLVLALTFFILCFYIMNVRSKKPEKIQNKKKSKLVKSANWSMLSQDLDQLEPDQLLNLTNKQKFNIQMSSLKNEIDLQKKQLQQLQKQAKEKVNQLKKVKRRIKRVKNNLKNTFQAVKLQNQRVDQFNKFQNNTKNYNSSNNSVKANQWNITQSNAQAINKTIGMDVHTLNINQVRRYSLQHPPQRSYFFNNTVKVAGAIKQSHELGHVLMFMGVTVFILFIFMSVSPVQCCHLFVSLFVSGILGFFLIELIKNISKQDQTGI